MSSLFARLQFSPDLAGSQLQDVSPEVKKHLDTMPPMLPTWAQQDMKDNNVGGYYTNPVAGISQNLSDYCTNIKNVTGIYECSVCSPIVAAANTLISTVPTYIAHTNRLSGVTAPTSGTITLPHLDTALNSGKMLSVLLYQTDGVQNNAPMIGSFSSLYTKDLFSDYANTIITFAGEITYSINISTVTVTDESGSSSYTTYTSNLTPERASTMTQTIAAVTSEMSSRKTNDENFYTNSQTIINEYGTLKKYNNMGATDTSMVGLVGSDKLKERINS